MIDDVSDRKILGRQSSEPQSPISLAVLKRRARVLVQEAGSLQDLAREWSFSSIGSTELLQYQSLRHHGRHSRVGSHWPEVP